MCDLRDGAGILDMPAGEEHMARRHQRGAIIDGALVQLERHADPVGTLQHHHLDPVRHLRQPLVRDGREVEGRYDDLRAPGVIERLGNAG
jgi:hypothetical protein